MFKRLAGIVKKLRSEKDGCPWDLAQTHASLKRYLREETREVLKAIDKGDPEELADELGDLLLQVVLHAQIASESGKFDINDVINAISDKMIRRHPHVFGNKKVKNVAEALAAWKEIKKMEKQRKKRRASAHDR